MLDSIEVEIREPTGLGLGTFDLYRVCQKIYEGELRAQCEFKASTGDWQPLMEHERFAAIFWLLGQTGEDDTAFRRARFGGWSNAKDKGGAAQPATEAGVPAASAANKRAPDTARTEAASPQEPTRRPGLLGKFFGKND